ncbi:MAG TPA: ATP-dependent 6-phosphofructokinase [Verrucomicrobiales bacterium]|nr:ATP-dependent 6-phosphofructokinase [Verrucomicrobiales bacterium]
MIEDLFSERPVALVFSGGDSPGMNAFLRAVVRLGLNRHRIPVLGIMEGYVGLVRTVKRLESGGITPEGLKREILDRPGIFGLHAQDHYIVQMNHESVSGLTVQGGIRLRSARSEEFRLPERRAQIIELLGNLNVRSVIVCGGDGSLKGADVLREESGFQVIGVPGTIDNDVALTDLALGVQSAVETLVWAVDHFKDTARSHRRVLVLETMGRACGELTQLAAIASGAEFAVIPEHEFFSDDRMREMAREMVASFDRGRSHSIILIAEGVGMSCLSWESRAWALARQLRIEFERGGGRYKDIETRASVLGHLQRGGRPAPFDAMLAAEFAEVAWEAIAQGRDSGITVLQNGEYKLVPFGSQPPSNRAARVERLHRLHKDLSAW